MLFQAMFSQWRTSMAGLTGLDYNVLATVEQRTGFSCASREDFAALQFLESAAMKELRSGD